MKILHFSIKECLEIPKCTYYMAIAVPNIYLDIGNWVLYKYNNINKNQCYLTNTNAGNKINLWNIFFYRGSLRLE